MTGDPAPIESMTLEQKQAAFLEISTELKIMVLYRAECECSDHLSRFSKTLVPTIIEHASRRMLDPMETFMAYTRSLHSGHVHDDVLFN